ncbi:MAG: homoserine kinase [Gammaproteobacteria bacterium]
MSVYTSLEAGDIQSLLDEYGQGRLLDFRGIEAGIENTNYFVTSEIRNSQRLEFVLTLFETTSSDNLDGYFDLMTHLANSGLPAAVPFKNESGNYLSCAHGKPAALIERLPGSSAITPNQTQCAEVGQFLAKMHTTVSTGCIRLTNSRGGAWRLDTIDKLASQISAEQHAFLLECHSAAALFEQANLPAGVIHGDLFHDNALYVGDELTGVIDFYYAHRAPYIYDLAVCIADWCFVQNGCAMENDNAEAILHGYQRRRPLIAKERELWPAALALAGLRFYLSRLHDRHFPRSGALTQEKDPASFLRLIEICQTRPRELLEMLDI